jgi:arabinan endo-1,5-alpha-L-arabinosidase
MDGKWMAWTVADWEADKACVALGENTASDPSKPRWEDRGPIVCSTKTTTGLGDTLAIDAEFFTDFSGKTWLVYGSHFSGIWIVELDPNTRKIKSGTTEWSKANTYCPSLSGTRSTSQAQLCGNTENLNGEFRHVAIGTRENYWENQHLPIPASLVEAAFIYPHNGFYYLFVNWGACCKGLDSSYEIRVGRTDSLDKPFLDKAGVSMGDGGGTSFFANTDSGAAAGQEKFTGPGHPGIYKHTDGEYVFTFHFYSSTSGNPGGSVGQRKLLWDAQGWPVLTKDLPNFMGGCSTVV